MVIVGSPYAAAFVIFAIAGLVSAFASTTVNETPSTVMEPFSTTYLLRAIGSAIRTTSQCCAGVRAMT